jgi:bacillithiol biosynthesis cysteine-adding enzyme BshC
MMLESYAWPARPGARQISEQYMDNFAQVKDLFDYSPFDPAALYSRAEWLEKTAARRADRARLAEALTAFNNRIHNAGQALANIRSLLDEQTVAVVGGQQAGLFTGPLYVIHKAVTLIRTAREAEQILGRKVVPVFWIAGEDHDFDEVNHIHYLSPEIKIEKIALDHPTGKKTPVSELRFAREEWISVWQRLDSALPETEFKAGLMERLRHMAEESATLVDLFARMLAWLFGEQGLILLDAADPAVRRVEAPMFKRLAEEHRELNREIIAGTRLVETLGYAPQAEAKQEQANLFFVHEGARHLLFYQSGRFVDREGKVSLTPEELTAIAETAPEKLSNNVFTRPLMQEYLLPVLGTVLGPGEIAYWAQLRPAFHYFGCRMPLIIPRLQFTLVEGTVRKHMDRYGFTFDDVVRRFAAKKAEWLDGQDTYRLEERFEQVKRQFDELYTPLLETIAEINPGLKNLGETNRKKIVEQIDYLKTRSAEAYESRFAAAIRQLERIHKSILPLNKPQERVYNVVAYLNKYGTDWMEKLLEAETDKKVNHYIVYL